MSLCVCGWVGGLVGVWCGGKKEKEVSRGLCVC